MAKPWERYAGQGSGIVTLPPDPMQQAQETRAQEAERRARDAAARAAAAEQRSALEWAATHNPDGTPLPKAQDQAYSQSALDAFDRAISSGERLKEHPGFGPMVGSGFDPQSWGSIKPWSGEPFAGTDAANFNAELAAMKAQVFLPMVQSMKGMGQLSNAEGQKLTDAIGALDTNMSEDAFKQSLNRIIGDLSSYRNRGAPPEQQRIPQSLTPPVAPAANAGLGFANDVANQARGMMGGRMPPPSAPARPATPWFGRVPANAPRRQNSQSGWGRARVID